MEIKLTSVLFYIRKKLLKIIMRTFIFLFCATVFSFTPKNVLSQNAKINIESNKTVTVDEVFDLIMSQTDYTFIYQVEMFKDFPKVKLVKGVIRVNKLLDKSLSSGDFNISFTDKNTIIILEKPEKELQEVIISGTVTDERGMPIPSVTVYVTKRKPMGETTSNDFMIRGTATDIDGRFSIKAKKGLYLVATALGYTYFSQEITSKTVYNITLKERASELDEVVVVGYGTQARREVSSAISSIKPKDLENNSVGHTSFDTALGGLIKGVRTFQRSGELGNGVEINIRGITSPFAGADNNPLFVIDGVPFQTNPNYSINDITAAVNIENPLQSINPADIESIDVLKDAAATAIYGSRGANGVIIVKTKRGRKNERMQVTLQANTTFGKPIGTSDYLTTEQWRDFNDEFFRNNALVASSNPFVSIFRLNNYAYMADLSIDFGTLAIAYNGENPDYYGNANTNWADEVYRDPAVTNQYNLSASGGSQSTNYSFAIGHTNQEGLLVGEDYNKYNARLGIDTDVNDNISMGVTANFGFTKTETGYSNLNNDLNNVLRGRPDITPRDENGNFNYMHSVLFGFYDFNEPNPLAALTGHIIENKGKNFLGNAYVEAEVLENLKAKADVNISMFETDSYRFSPQSVVGIQSPLFAGLESTAFFSTVINSTVVSNFTLNYSNTIMEHDFSGLFGLAYDRNTTDREVLLLAGFPDDEVLINATSARAVTDKGSNKVETGLNSVFGRLTYSYDSKYFMTINLRSDRSIKFGPENQRAFFPSVAVSWNISNESFMNKSVFNNLRLRASIGRTGSNNVGDFAYLQFFAPGVSDEATYGGIQAIGLTGDLPNEDIKWETTDEVNIGLNFGLLNNRISGSVDWYNRKTKGALMPTPYVLETGATAYTANFADLTNKGFEIELDGDIIRNNDLNWSINLNLAKNTNTLDKFAENGIDPSLLDFYELGREVNIIRGYQVEKIFQDQAEIDQLNANAPDGFYQRPATGPGDYKYVDLDGDGEITIDDRKYLGSAQPDFFGGFNTEVNYKGFSLGVYFNYSVGGESTWSETVGNKTIYQPNYNTFSIFYENVWTPERTDAEFPRLIVDDPNNNRRISNRSVFDTSFLRLKVLQLGYSLPDNVVEKLGLSKVSFYVNGANLWTTTKFPGINPEARNRGLASIRSLQNRDPYPIAKTWSLGINAKF